jgi:phospholipid-binding lipoprotein MlaA
VRTCLHVGAGFEPARIHRDAGWWGVLVVVGIVMGAGCAASPRSKLQTHVTPPSDANFSGESAFDELEAEFAQKQVSVADPLEPVNRVIFGVNDVLYCRILKPVRQVYVGVVPKPVRIGIRNFFHNLATPARIVNCILQGKNPEADVELQRFAINTTVGVLGFGDPARDRWGLKPAEEDLGQTLAVYGFGDGFYVVWPLLGASTLRDSVGLVGDMFLDPVFYIEPEALAIGLSATNTANDMSFRLEEYESLKAATVDPYIAMREAYLQYRKKQIRGNDLPADPNRPKP